MHIAYPSFLILALLILLFWWFFFREKVGLPFPNRLMRRYARLDWRISLIWILRGLCITLVFLILANPTTSISQRIPLSAGNPIILTLDISKSMLADDIRPSRIERAKGVIDAFLAHESANQYGLVIFAGKAFTLSPLTTDRTGLRNIIENITTDTIRQYLPGLSGTNIGDALLAGMTVGEHATGTTQSIILITDGRANLGIDPMLATETLRERGIRVYTIGIGEASGSILSYIGSDGIRTYFYDDKGEKLRADVDEAILRQIAEKTGGAYYRASDAHMLENVFDTLDQTLNPPLQYETVERMMSLRLPLVLLLSFFFVLHGLFLFWMRKQ